mmetsp:Transcript_80/g.178  ORF Transcript_80/g.178 Transcript_80/m.178 type:complete len:404 (-) Transcript_80:108-1319(-)
MFCRTWFAASALAVVLLGQPAHSEVLKNSKKSIAPDDVPLDDRDEVDHTAQVKANSLLARSLARREQGRNALHLSAEEAKAWEAFYGTDWRLDEEDYQEAGPDKEKHSALMPSGHYHHGGHDDEAGETLAALPTSMKNANDGSAGAGELAEEEAGTQEEGKVGWWRRRHPRRRTRRRRTRRRRRYRRRRFRRRRTRRRRARRRRTRRRARRRRRTRRRRFRRRRYRRRRRERRRRTRRREMCIYGHYWSAQDSKCLTCTGGFTSRRRDSVCTPCPEPTFDDGDRDFCRTCEGGYVRRRRATSCTACPAGKWADGIAGECQSCEGGEVRRRRAVSCTDCPVSTYQMGRQDSCTACTWGSVRRRRATSCDACEANMYGSADSDDCDTHWSLAEINSSGSSGVSKP